MATLVLTTIGTAVGGPLGGALGGFLGQQVDQNILFAPSAQQGPRLDALAIQTSSYGSQIPRMFGRMRVAGTVVWAADLKESAESSGGKGRPRRTTYSYSASFAVALSSRPIRGVGRIWADGKLFRGSGGDFKTATDFRLYHGHEDQPVDGMIASAEGERQTPAYRGLALAVFADMDLTDYGNRIPSLTIEVIADDGAVALTDIVADISDHRVLLSSAETLHGFAAGGESRRDAIQSVGENFSLSYGLAGQRIHAGSRHHGADHPVTVISGDLVGSAQGRNVDRQQTGTRPESKVVRQYGLRYYEPDRDYQSGLQIAFRPGASRREKHADFPAALQGEGAKALAQARLWSLYHERRSSKFSILRSSALVTPGSLVQLADHDTRWHVRGWELHRGFITLTLSQAADAPLATPAKTDSGRPLKQPDNQAGQTRLALIDLPFAIEAPGQMSSTPCVYAAAAGDTGWRGADLYRQLSSGAGLEPIGHIARRSVIGTALQTIAPAAPYRIDRQQAVIVQLHDTEMQLFDAARDALLEGYNLAVLGSEIIQFGEAAPLGDGRYRLSELYRGLGGSEAEGADHEIGEDFILLAPELLTPLDSRFVTPFQPLHVAAVGRGDESPVARTLPDPGRALRPWSPVHPCNVRRPDGGLDIVWTRRSRAGLSWLDHVETPLGEEQERYQIVLAPGTALEQNHDLSHPSFAVEPSAVDRFRSAGMDHLPVVITQIGQFARSDPLSFSVSL